MAKLLEITAIPLEERYRRDSFAIHTAKRGDGANVSQPIRFSIKGESEPDEFKPGVSYRLYGRWEPENQWGPTFSFNSFAPITPHGKTGIIAYLKQARHIGDATAYALWEAFSGDAVRILREEPERASEAVGRRFPVEKAREAAEDLEVLKAAENITIELHDLFDGRGFGKGCVRQAIKMWGAEAVSILRRDPLKAQALRGVGWKKADAFYLALGKDPAKLKRQAYCLAYAGLKEADQAGHVWTPLDSAIDGLKASISGADVSPEKALVLATRGRVVKTRIDKTGKAWIADIRRAQAEQYVAEKIIDAMASQLASPVVWPSMDHPAFGEIDGKKPTQHQLEELQKALSGPIAALCGRAGAGKSFLVARLIKALVEMYGEDSILCVSPTNAATIRCREFLLSIGCEGVKAATTYSALGVESSDGEWTFKHNERNPFTHKFIIGDEWGMVGLGHMRSFISAVPNGCGFLMTGDPNQLVSVEYGAVLRDLIAAGLPCGELTEIHRNAGSSVKACSAICDGLPWQFDDQLDLKVDPPKNFVLIPAGKHQAQNRLLHFLSEIRDNSPYDAIWDTQVLVAVNKKSPLSRMVLNQKIQELLNPAPGNSKTPFRTGDKVVQRDKEQAPLAKRHKDRKTGNDDWKQVDGEKVTIYKGEFGKVLFAEEKRTVVQFFNPDRVVLMYRSSENAKKSRDEDGSGDGADNEDTGTGCNMDLGYAVTTHVMQGSQQKIIIYCIDEYPGASGQYGVCDRSHIYVGFSRHTVACFAVGLKHVADSICSKRFIWRRKTFLSETIQELAAKAGVTLNPPREPGGPSLQSLFVNSASRMESQIQEESLW
jgi:hypothetical protein